MDEKVILDGFTVLSTTYEGRKCHPLLIKKHDVRVNNSAKPNRRTLLVKNIPPYVDQVTIGRLFSQYGAVENIVIQKKASATTSTGNISKYFPTQEPVKGFKVAYIVYKHESSVDKAINTTYEQTKDLSDDRAISTNSLSSILRSKAEWIKNYEDRVTPPDKSRLEEEINSYMNEYDTRVQEEVRKKKEAEGQADDEGWITVGKKGIARTETKQKRLTTQERKKRKEKELLNFYKFQMRENKREEIAKLRKEFQKDKEKLAVLKSARKFRPM